MGMSYDEFWNKDVSLAWAYRRADQIKRERRNEELWLQGMYIYEALLDVAPVIRTTFSKTPPKPIEYRKKPYPLTKEAAQRENVQAQNSKIESMIKFFQAESALNKIHEEQRKEAGNDGDDERNAD